MKCDKGWVHIWQRPCVKQWPPQTSFNLLAKAWKQEEGGDLSDGLLIGSWEKTQSLSIMTMLQLNVKSAFSLKNSYVYVLVNNETRLRMVYSKQLKHSPW